MALTITPVPDFQFYLGPSIQARAIVCAPAVSDYPTGGYVLTAEQCTFGNGHLLGGTVLSQQYSTSGAPVYVVNLSSTAYTTNPQPNTIQLNISAYWDGNVNNSYNPEVTANADLSLMPFQLLVYGY